MVLHQAFRARHVRATGIGGEVRHGVASGALCESSLNKHVTPHLHREYQAQLSIQTGRFWSPIARHGKYREVPSSIRPNDLCRLLAWIKAAVHTKILHVYGFDSIEILFPGGEIPQHRQLPRRFDPKDLSL